VFYIIWLAALCKINDPLVLDDADTIEYPAINLR